MIMRYENMNDMSLQIHNERRKRGISQASLAKQLNIYRNTLIQIERGMIPVTYDTVLWAIKGMDAMQQENVEA
jgi:DNA-binding XRE family transcriptional regulator